MYTNKYHSEIIRYIALRETRRLSKGFKGYEFLSCRLLGNKIFYTFLVRRTIDGTWYKCDEVYNMNEDRYFIQSK